MACRAGRCLAAAALAVVAMILPPRVDLAPEGRVAGARAATIRLPHRWPEGQPCDEIAALVAAEGATLLHCLMPRWVQQGGGDFAASLSNLAGVAGDPAVVGSGVSLSSRGWEFSGAGALDLGIFGALAWGGTENVVVLAEQDETGTGRVMGRRYSGATALVQALLRHPVSGMVWALEADAFVLSGSSDWHAIGFRGLEPWLDGAAAGPPLSAGTIAPVTGATLHVGALWTSQYSGLDSPFVGAVAAVVTVSGTVSAATMAAIETQMERQR
jgi:hypothetical protein